MQTTYHVAKEVPEGFVFLIEPDNAFCKDQWAEDLIDSTAFPMRLAMNIVDALGHDQYHVIERAEFDGEEAVRAV